MTDETKIIPGEDYPVLGPVPPFPPLWTRRGIDDVWMLQGSGDRRDLSVYAAKDGKYSYAVWTSRDATYSDPLLTVNGFADALAAQAVAVVVGIVSDADALALGKIRDEHEAELTKLQQNCREAELHIRGAYEAELAVWWHDNRKGSPRGE